MQICHQGTTGVGCWCVCLELTGGVWEQVTRYTAKAVISELITMIQNDGNEKYDICITRVTQEYVMVLTIVCS